jgi:hypothetical protein
VFLALCCVGVVGFWKHAHDNYQLAKPIKGVKPLFDAKQLAQVHAYSCARSG